MEAIRYVSLKASDLAVAIVQPWYHSWCSDHEEGF